MEKVNLKEKLALFSDFWTPRIVGDVNNMQVKLAKLKGEFVWHAHEKEDELFLVVQGEFDMHYEDRVEHVKEGEFIIVPKGVRHKPVAEKEVHVLLFESASTINTGSSDQSEFTKTDLDRI